MDTEAMPLGVSCTLSDGTLVHMTEDEVRPPKWGWILDPSPGDWDRISEGSPAIATGGNAQLRATSRCMTCMGTLGSW